MMAHDHELYRQAPTGTTLLLRYQPPYDWEAMLAFLAARALGMPNADWPALSHAFPKATRLADAELAALGMPRARAASLSAIGSHSLRIDIAASQTKLT
jgi:hypothetical protein